MNIIENGDKIVVLDINHGAHLIAKQLVKKGYKAVAVDVYGKTAEEEKQRLSVQSDIKITDDKRFVESADVVILPVHLSPENKYYKVLKRSEKNIKTIITHHEAVSFILAEDKRLQNKKIIEITGSTGKTSTAILYAMISSYKYEIVTNTTRGIEIWKFGIPEVIYEKTSISPSQIPEVLDIVFKNGYNPDIFLFEISLGFTKLADLNIITSLLPEYKIAGNTVDSTVAKLNFLSSRYLKDIHLNKTIIDIEQRNYLEKQEIESSIKSNVITFNKSKKNEETLNSADYNVFLESEDVGKLKNEKRKNEKIENRLNVKTTETEFILNIQEGFAAKSYEIAFAAAITAAFETGINEKYIRKAIEEFEGIPGRMKEIKEEGIIIFDNSGSGVNKKSCLFAIDYIEEKYIEEKKENKILNDRNIFLVIGEEEENVCEGFPPEDVKKVVEKAESVFGEIEVIFVGKRFQEMNKIKPENYFTGKSLDDSMKKIKEKIKEKTKENNEENTKDKKEKYIILSFVKCFR